MRRDQAAIALGNGSALMPGRKAAAHRFPSPRAQLPAQFAIIQQRGHCRRNRFLGALLHEPAVLAVSDDLRNAARITGDHRLSHRHRLDDRQAEGFLVGGMHEQIELMEKRPDILLESAEMDAIRDAALTRSFLEVRPHLGNIGAQDDYVQVGKCLAQPGDRADKFVVPLPGIHARRYPCDAGILGDAELLANRRAVLQLFLRIEVVGVDGIVYL